ncbi:MAG: Lrp/AsnC family transcriptional regulator [Thermoprotei archaeon]|nr:MAG: Lrp/AsnC family transcriptional regulator [Thermoprotei archaeon]RLE88041.1 MAG: Lrp/AsnC family transcriptional regulator [Thermoprotei archaeon]
MIAYVLIAVKPRREYDVFDALKQFQEIKDALITYGEWDIVARVEVKTFEELDKVLYHIRRVDGVEYTATLIGV